MNSMTWASVPPPPPPSAGSPAAAAAGPSWEAWLAAWFSPNAVSKLFDFCGTTQRALAEELAFPDLEVLLDVSGLAAAAAVPHLPTHLQVYGHE